MLRLSVCKFLSYRLFNQSLLNLLFLLSNVLQHIQFLTVSVDFSNFCVRILIGSREILIQVGWLISCRMLKISKIVWSLSVDVCGLLWWLSSCLVRHSCILWFSIEEINIHLK